MNVLNRLISTAVLVPTYKGSKTLNNALDSLVCQSIQNFIVYLNDDTPPTEFTERDELKKIVEQYSHLLDIDFIQNDENLGYPRNLMALVARSSEENIFLLAQDDVLSPIAIESCVKALSEFPQAIAVSRPYFWFDKSLNSPIRQIPNFDSSLPELVTADSEWWKIERTLVAASQLTGLMYCRSGLREPFVNSIFPAHIYPLAGALRDGGVVYLPYPTVAVSIEHSQTRTLSSIYRESPAMAWITLYKKVFAEDKFTTVRKNGLMKHMGKNFVGLIQIRSFGRYRYFLRELGVMIYARRMNVVDPRFVLTAVGLAVLPRRLTIFLVSNFKSKVIGKTLTNVRLATERDAWWL
jgi:glycosyltransferase involved in cell wall biosynthesis